MAQMPWGQLQDIRRLKVYFQFADNRMQFDSKYSKTMTMEECVHI